MPWHYYTDRAMLQLRLEIAAPYSGPSVIRDAVHNLMSVAWKLNVVTICNLNGCDLICSPDDADVEAKVDALRNAWALNATSVT